MSIYDRNFSTYLDIALTDEDREIWDRMPYRVCNTYMQAHQMDTGISHYMTWENYIVRPMQPSVAVRVRFESAQRLGVLNDRFAIY